ncbi:MAG TPA: S9 family peptidase [Gemmatimonas aurantiaca]|uniref:S9 family peptidase n=2 Tax=Gemmatimonas aurantiaca TaxID=173480 RepID=A0A3D4V9F7_9BACT|nr:prolyl oligopeptidase family serine peptidase [Gemmatimonas aurantiaca]BAH40255.1 putative peptidase [Gemmatimonas aurantiaca T-27]HCT57735.1 S9 family peptidase [Gemmatimonas aurantiaca]
MRRTTAPFVPAALLLGAALGAQPKPTVTPADFAQWEVPGAPRISPRGDWTALPISRLNDDNEVRLIGGPRDTTIVVPFGSPVTFGASNEWVGMLIGMSTAERERLTKEKKPIRNSVQLRNLANGQVITEAEVSGFTFSANGRYAALTRYPAEGKQVSDVVVYDLARGTRLTFSSVREHTWADAAGAGGALLALAIDGDGSSGHSVQLYDAAGNSLRVLENGGAPYRALAWRRQSLEFAALRGVVDKAFRDTAYVVLNWRDVTATAAPRTLDGSKATGFPAGVRIAEHRRPSWSRDGQVLFFGTRPRLTVADAIKKSAEKVSDVEIWHTNDVRMFAQQKVQEAQDLRSTLLAAWRADDRVVPVGTDLNEQSAALESGRWATEIDRKPYPWEWKFGRNVQDVYAVNLETGARSKVLERVRHYYGGDPTGTKLAWSDGRDYWVVDLASGKRTNLTASVTRGGKADFVDHDDDHPTDIPHIFPIVAWSKQGDALLVNDTHDVWRLAADGSAATRLTNGAREQVAHRLVSAAGFNASVVDRAVDLSAPQYFALTGRQTKQSGYARLNADGTVQRLLLIDAGHSGFVRADSANVVAFLRQRYDTSPNVFVGADPASAKAVTATNPQQSKFAWGKVELMNFRSTINVPLQALLYYPANYDPAKKYPLIVYTYERLTQGLHGYIAPNNRNYYNATVFSQEGYFVLMPDIVFRPREPGIGTKYAVEPAVRTLIAKGLVDAKRVGHVGHSQGGYEAAYLATHSNLFQTTIVGSGITDMISFAGQLHWSGGTAEFDHWETGQFRMQVAPWEDMKAMLDNSPLARVHQMQAKSMLIEIGSDDGTVDPRQGSLFYNYARRAGKHVVMLTYPGEGHGLTKRENQRDYQTRILEWFGHYLKGEPAAKWITNGQTALERRAILDANK